VNAIELLHGSDVAFMSNYFDLTTFYVLVIIFMSLLLCVLYI